MGLLKFAYQAIQGRWHNWPDEEVLKHGSTNSVNAVVSWNKYGFLDRPLLEDPPFPTHFSCRCLHKCILYTDGDDNTTLVITTYIWHVGVMRFSRGSYIAPAAFPVHLMVSCLPANLSISSLPAFISPLCEWYTFMFLSGITLAVYGQGIVKSLRGQAICSKRKGVANRKKDIWRTTSFKAQVCIISKN